MGVLDLGQPQPRSSTPPVEEHAERHCRDCGRERGPKSPPLLRPDLVIAARERNRDPELPAETVEQALTAQMPTTAARYDLVVMPPDPETAPALRSIAAEFARHDHRVFWLEATGEAERAYAGPRPPRLKVVPWPTVDGGLDFWPALENLRTQHGIETAALLLSPSSDRSSSTRCRREWGWRAATVVPPGDSGLPAVELLGDDKITPASRMPRLQLRSEATWPARWGLLDRALRSAWPRASVIVVTIDNLAFTKLCLASLLANTEYPNLEILVVDNCSTDGTPELLREIEARHVGMRVLLNRENRGFGPANNQALAEATGELFVLLNNDTMVTPGWLSRLGQRLDDPSLGLVGPATNRTCNEAQVAADYRTYEELIAFARDRNRRFDGQLQPIRMLAMFCVAFGRSLYEEIGPLDDRYAIGMFEDEDYALSAKASGYAVAWAPDVYVHHAYHASIGKLVPTGAYLPLFRTNQQKFEHKWGICWERHRPPA